MNAQLRLPMALLTVFATQALFFAGLADTQARQSRKLVEAVEVLGNLRLPAKDILSRVKTRPGQVYRADQAQTDLRILLGLGIFHKEQTRVLTQVGRRGGVVVIFEVAELPTIKGIRFEGLKSVKEAEIINALRQKRVDLSRGVVYDPVQLRKGMQVIKQYLESRRWSQVRVTAFEETGDRSDEISVTLIIEGEDYAIINAAHNNTMNPTRPT